MQLHSVRVHFLVFEATFSENTLLHGGYICSLKCRKTLIFCTCICIAVREKEPGTEPWKYFTSADETSILNWFADNIKLYDDSPEYSRIGFDKTLMTRQPRSQMMSVSIVQVFNLQSTWKSSDQYTCDLPSLILTVVPLHWMSQHSAKKMPKFTVLFRIPLQRSPFREGPPVLQIPL